MIAEQVLSTAVRGLESWNKGVNLDEILDGLSVGAEKENRSKVSSILFNYFRNKAYIDYVIDSLVNRKIESIVRRIISVALVQVFYQDGVAKEVAVDVAVNYARKLRNRKTGGFVNAILRNAIRGAFEKAGQNAPEYVKYNVSSLLLDRWSKAFSIEEKRGIINVIKKQAPFTFRALKTIDNSIVDECNCQLIENLFWCGNFSFYKTDRPDLIMKSDLLDSGSIYIQDSATAMAPCLAVSEKHKKILDICAAPGGKTLMFSELYPDAEIVAMDRSAKRLERVSQNIKRTKKNNIITVAADALNPPFDKSSFDIIFADVPCSNTGVIRRRPDVMWRFTQKHLTEILKLQMGIIESASSLVAPGGLFVYSTCSIEKEENRNQIDKFLSCNKNFEFVRDRLLLPSELNDGAYGAVIRKKLHL
jgi:16S rRNA (cytosine967-C5)-methyltransferase